MKKILNILGELWNEEEGFIRKKDSVKSEYSSGKCDLTYSVEQQRELLHETKIA